MQPTIHRASTVDLPSLHQILIACGLDLKLKFGLTHWMLPLYPLESLLKDAQELEVYALKVGENLVGTFTLDFALTEPLSYVKFGNINWQISNVPAVYRQFVLE